MRRALRLDQLRATSPAPDQLAAALADEVRRGRVERVGDAYALTATGARELHALADITKRETR